MSSSVPYFQDMIDLIRRIYGDGVIDLHRPVFAGDEKKYLNDCIDSHFVSSVGAFVDEFEQKLADFTGARFAIATVNGTSALHTALHLAGVGHEEEVITQALTFVATCNAIRYCGAEPVFIDVDRDTMGMSHQKLAHFLQTHAEKRDGAVWNKQTGRRIAACLPMHTFGVACRIAEITELCAEWGMMVIEDAAESLGSYAKGQHSGTFGQVSALSFNGNKIITTGGGGAVLTNDETLAQRVRHITSTAKRVAGDHQHDEIGFNYRMPALNAALGCAQMAQLPAFLRQKRDVAQHYEQFFTPLGIKMARPLSGDEANFWLNAIILSDEEDRDAFLRFSHAQDIMTRPAWQLMTDLPMFATCQHDGLAHSQWLAARVVNLPSSVPPNASSNSPLQIDKEA